MTTPDPFDPFAEKEKTFETKNIKNSKAGRSNAKKKSAPAPSAKKKRPSVFKRIGLFFKSLPEREDRKKIYFASGLTVFTLVTLVLSYKIFFSNSVNELIETNQKKAKVAETIVLSDSLNENGSGLVSAELLEKELESTKTPNERILLLANLARLYYESGEKEKALAAYEKILAYPETEDLEINGLPWGGVRETYLEEYNRIKNE